MARSFATANNGNGTKYPCICFSVFHREIPLIFMDFILRNIYSGTYAVPGNCPEHLFLIQKELNEKNHW